MRPRHSRAQRHRRPLRRLLVGTAAVVSIAATAAGCDWPDGTRYVDLVFDEVEVTRDIVYRTTTTHTGETIDLRLDIYEPAGDTAEERPAVFWMFGGGWQNGDRDQLAAYARDSALRGYVGVTIDYRIRPEGGDMVAAAWDAYDDAVAAAQWLADNAAEHRIDPDAIVAGGVSAGAINAVHLLYAPGTREPAESPVAGAVAISGTTFVTAPAGRPPLLMHHGTADEVVPYQWASDTCTNAVDAGSECELVSYDGEGHQIAATEFAPIVEDSADFIFERVLWPLGYRVESPEAAA